LEGNPELLLIYTNIQLNFFHYLIALTGLRMMYITKQYIESFPIILYKKKPLRVEAFLINYKLKQTNYFLPTRVMSNVISFDKTLSPSAL
jgi:hypothetical protein